MNILDPKFKYTPASNTDIRAKFRQIQRAYIKAWDEAHAYNIEFDKLERQQKVRRLG